MSDYHHAQCNWYLKKRHRPKSISPSQDDYVKKSKRKEEKKNLQQ